MPINICGAAAYRLDVLNKGDHCEEKEKKKKKMKTSWTHRGLGQGLRDSEFNFLIHIYMDELWLQVAAVVNCQVYKFTETTQSIRRHVIGKKWDLIKIMEL